MPKKPKKGRVAAQANIVVAPRRGWAKKEAARLPKFRPRRLDDLIASTKSGTAGIDAARVLQVRRDNNKQLEQVVRALGLDPATRGVWRHAFFKLCMIHHGVGHFWWRRPRGKNR